MLKRHCGRHFSDTLSSKNYSPKAGICCLQAISSHPLNVFKIGIFSRRDLQQSALLRAEIRQPHPNVGNSSVFCLLPEPRIIDSASTLTFLSFVRALLPDVLPSGFLSTSTLFETIHHDSSPALIGFNKNSSTSTLSLIPTPYNPVGKVTPTLQTEKMGDLRRPLLLKRSRPSQCIFAALCCHPRRPSTTLWYVRPPAGGG